MGSTALFLHALLQRARPHDQTLRLQHRKSVLSWPERTQRSRGVKAYSYWTADLKGPASEVTVLPWTCSFDQMYLLQQSPQHMYHQLNITLMAPVLPAAAAVSKPVMMSLSEKPKRCVIRGPQSIFFSSRRSKHVGYCSHKTCEDKICKIFTLVTVLHFGNDAGTNNKQHKI